MAAAPAVHASMLVQTLDRRMQVCMSHGGCLAQLRTICESRIGGCSHKLLLQQHLPVHVSDAMALVAFDLQTSSTSGATA